MLELLKVPSEKDEMKTADRQPKHLRMTLENGIVSSFQKNISVSIERSLI